MDGSPHWTQQFGNGSQFNAFALAATTGGEVVVGGFTYGTLTGVSAGRVDAFLRQYRDDGSVGWSRQFGTEDDDEVWGVAFDETGSLWVAGHTAGSIAAANQGRMDGFVRRYAP